LIGVRILAAAVVAAAGGLFAASSWAMPGDDETVAKASILDDNPDDIAAVVKVCTVCHGASVFLDAPRSSARWEETYAQMAGHGARGSIDELNGVVHYMQKNLTVVDVNTSPAEELGPTLQADDDAVDAILARRQVRPFSGVDDLAQVRGVDRKVLDKLNSRHLLLF
jgi:mono/diheme cytochrome c family protein